MRRRPGAGWSAALDCSSGSESMKANVPPGCSQRRTIARNSASLARGTWLSQKPVKTASTCRSGSAHASRTWRCARSWCATRRSRARSSGAAVAVVERQLALRGEERRPPAGPGRELDDLAPDRELVEPAPGDIELGVPGRVVDGPALVAPATQVPVVVFGGAGLVVGEHGRRRRRSGTAVGPAPAASATRPSAAAPAPPRARSAPGATGSAGSRCHRPCRRSPDRAAPSPRGRPDRGRHARPRTTGNRTSRETALARVALRPDRRPRAERRDVDEGVGVEDLGQQLDAVDDARPRAG